MPIAKIQLPDGRIARFEVPEGTTQEEVLAFAEQNAASFQQQAPIDKGMAAQQTPSQTMPQDPVNFAQFRPREEITQELGLAQRSLRRSNRDEVMRQIIGLQEELKQLDEFRSGTRAAQELPEIGSQVGIAQLLPDIPTKDQLIVSSALATMSDPQEIAGMLRNASPDIGIVQDEAGNLIAANNRTGVQTIINRPGASPLDAMQFTGRAALFTPAGRAVGAVPTIGGAIATEAAIQGVESAAGGEFDPEAVVTEGLGTVAGLGIGKAFRGMTPQQIRQGEARELLLNRLEQQEPSAELLGQKAVRGQIVKGRTKAIAQAKKQGVDERVLRTLETSSPETRKNLRESVAILKKRMTDKEFGIKSRSSDPIGHSVFKRYEALNNARKKIGQELDSISRKDLKGVNVNVQQVNDEFFNSLKDLGVRFRAEGDKIVPSFSGMDDIKEAGARQALDKILPRIKDDMTGLQAHKLKKLIDSAVEFDARPTQDVPLPKALDSALKKMRASLNSSIADASPAYKDANARFAEVKQPLSQMDKIFKNMLNLSDDRAVTAAIGTKASRDLMSNNIGRGTMLDIVENAENALKNNGVEFNDDIIKQVVFIDELERMFGSQASTSFTGSSQRAVESGIRAALGDTQSLSMDLLQAGVEKARGVNEKNAIKALEAMLK